MTPDVGREARIPNPHLERFAVLVGTWTTVGTHPMVPGTTFHGRTTFEWGEGGAFLLMRSEIEEPGIPSGIAIIGSDDAARDFSMLYFDERAVSRRYDVTMDGEVMTWSRNAPDLSQRFRCTLAKDRRSMLGRGVLSRDGSTWEGDLELAYTRTD
jgi:hypothetical protein